jgi:geranylgeranyl pyrophosphate synthase
MDRSGSISHARGVAEGLVSEAKGELEGVADSAAKRLLVAMAEAVVAREN